MQLIKKIGKYWMIVLSRYTHVSLETLDDKDEFLKRSIIKERKTPTLFKGSVHEKAN